MRARAHRRHPYRWGCRKSCRSCIGASAEHPCGRRAEANCRPIAEMGVEDCASPGVPTKKRCDQARCGALAIRDGVRPFFADGKGRGERRTRASWVGRQRNLPLSQLARQKNSVTPSNSPCAVAPKGPYFIHSVVFTPTSYDAPIGHLGPQRLPESPIGISWPRTSFGAAARRQHGAARCYAAAFRSCVRTDWQPHRAR